MRPLHVKQRLEFVAIDAGIGAVNQYRRDVGCCGKPNVVLKAVTALWRKSESPTIAIQSPPPPFIPPLIRGVSL